MCFKPRDNHTMKGAGRFAAWWTCCLYWINKWFLRQCPKHKFWYIKHNCRMTKIKLFWCHDHNAARCTREIKWRIPMPKIALYNRNNLFHQQIWLKFEGETRKLKRLKHSFLWCWNLNTSDGNQKYLASWISSVGPILWKMKYCIRTKEKRNILDKMKRKKKAKWIDHIFHLSCFLKHCIPEKREGRTEVTGGQGRKLMQLLDDLTEKRRYWDLNEEAFYHILYRKCFGRGYRSVVREREIEEFVINQIYCTSFKNVKNKRLAPVLNNVPYVHAGMQGLFIATSKIQTFYPSNPILMAAHILYNNIC